MSMSGGTTPRMFAVFLLELYSCQECCCFSVGVVFVLRMLLFTFESCLCLVYFTMAVSEEC